MNLCRCPLSIGVVRTAFFSWAPKLLNHMLCMIVAIISSFRSTVSARAVSITMSTSSSYACKSFFCDLAGLLINSFVLSLAVSCVATGSTAFLLRAVHCFFSLNFRCRLYPRLNLDVLDTVGCHPVPPLLRLIMVAVCVASSFESGDSQYSVDTQSFLILARFSATPTNPSEIVDQPRSPLAIMYEIRLAGRSFSTTLARYSGISH
ncbi:hypothetical protein DPMN_116401 [Dreissena polymorpha]|uniref:Uncharacterized protein n=1 Tax=Dreissena polymorpha TaxID=45954 RepID=A0A9D4QU97_DREPO|nr:hypothetical protein DPMN_116401 [Dreissena polymorpha]